MVLYKKYLFIIAVLGGILFPPFLIYAAYPEYNDLYVNDFDHVFRDVEEAELQSLMQRFKSDAGIEAVIVTIDTYANYKTGDPTFEKFATGLFNSWGVGDKTKNNGIMVLLSITDRVVRIELGTGYSQDYDARMQNIIDKYMLPAFKQNKYYDGILMGTQALYTEMTGKTVIKPATVPADNHGGGNIRPALIAKILFSKFLHFGGGFALLFLIAGFIINIARRYKPRKCERCGISMELLQEDLDDSFLQKGQIHEESLRSVDYDVWKCPSCSELTILKYRRLLSRYRYCPSCSFRTVRVTSRTISPATYSSKGTGERTFQCQNCDYEKTEQYVIPKKERDSSVSFGGGSSSGGGASGRW